MLAKKVALKSITNASCSKKPYKFLPFLYTYYVGTTFPTKWKFFGFYVHMINCMKRTSVGKITHNISRENRVDKDDFILEFYDEIHKYPVLTIEVKENKSRLFFDIHPF
ncbi:hypothetical protein SAMN04487894_1096 [Niabella drilacis]|uniref:Uncharacterized protein n=1 Tax=Niabella drilacis (strain DSM 25811 / CCM 8410 / CCUG 62505 / LMG 26954 / E90) TaxID=1285928 RepID=A0A1G6UJV6_NIADE|nr:hypothetical protein SAMN04487894_1096 [Niabella drilacis]